MESIHTGRLRDGTTQSNTMVPTKSEVVEEVKVIIQAPKRAGLWFVDELRWLVRVIISSGDRFYWDGGFSKAASLAYTTLLSLVPALALTFGILSSFAVSSSYISQARRFLFDHFIPDQETADTILMHLTSFSENLASVNALVIFFLVMTSLLLLNSIEFVLNEVWQVFEARSIAHRIQIFCAIVLIFPVLLISGVYFVQLRVEGYLSSLEDLPLRGVVRTLYAYLFPFLIDFAGFVSLYYLVPKAPVRFRSAVFGAFLAAILFAAAKGLFAIYIEEISSYSKVYGTVAAIPIFLFWLYLAWTIVLFGAEASYQAQYLPRTGKLWKRSVMTIGDAKLVLAMQALVMITRAFLDGKKLPSDLEIAESLGCSSVVLKPALDALEHADIISRGEMRDQPLTLLRSPDKISLEQIREALFKGRSAISFPKQMERVFSAFATRGASGHTTLAEILNSEEAENNGK